MPLHYTTKELHEVYDQIALERPHVCDECGTSERLSHSHLAPKAHFPKLATEKTNIVYHCLSTASKIGCHDNVEGMNVARMKNFEKYYKFLHGHSKETRKYFWLRVHKLESYWCARDMDTWRRVRALMAECDKIEHPMVKATLTLDENGGDRN